MPIFNTMAPSGRPGKPTDNQGTTILKIIWVLTSFTTLLVVARMYVRSVLLRKIGLDDYLIFVSIVCISPPHLDVQILN